MASEIFGEALGYDELGVHRHLVVSERLRLRRRTLGLTQKEVVARLRRLGVTTTNKSLSSLEHGAGLDVGKLPELARALDCTLTYLVGLTDDPERWEPDSRGLAERGAHPGRHREQRAAVTTTGAAGVPGDPRAAGPAAAAGLSPSSHIRRISR